MTDKGPTRIQLCGRLAVELEGRDLTAKLPGGQARVLFTYLTVHRALPSRREQMIEALWPWRPPDGADASLSALLSRLRTALGADVLVGRSEISVNLPNDAWIDLEAVEAAIHRAEAAVAQRDWARGWGPSLIALFTARRGFLPGEDLPWAEEYRRRLEDIRPVYFLRSLWNVAVVFVDQRLRFYGVDVSGNHKTGVVGKVERFVELIELVVRGSVNILE